MKRETGVVQVGVRLRVDTIRGIDIWRAEQIGHPSRAQSVRWILEQFIKHQGEAHDDGPDQRDNPTHDRRRAQRL
jgi:hypothetical protein